MDKIISYSVKLHLLLKLFDLKEQINWHGIQTKIVFFKHFKKYHVPLLFKRKFAFFKLWLKRNSILKQIISWHTDISNTFLEQKYHNSDSKILTIHRKKIIRSDFLNNSGLQCSIFLSRSEMCREAFLTWSFQLNVTFRSDITLYTVCKGRQPFP